MEEHSFNKTFFLQVVEQNNAVDLAPLHLLLFDVIPGKNIIRNNLRRFNGFDFEDRNFVATKILGFNKEEVIKICDLMKILYQLRDSKESLAEKLSSRLCNTSTLPTSSQFDNASAFRYEATQHETANYNRSNADIYERETRRCRDDHDIDNNSYRNVTDIDNSNSRNEKTRHEIHEDIEFIDEEHLKILTEIDNVEDTIDNLEVSEENQKERRSLQM